MVANATLGETARFHSHFASESDDAGMRKLQHVMRRLALSEAARERLAHLVAGLLIAVIVVCVVLVVVSLMKQGQSHTRPNYPTTRFSTTTPTPHGRTDDWSFRLRIRETQPRSSAQFWCDDGRVRVLVTRGAS